MKDKKSIRYKFRIIIMLATIVTLILSIVLINFEVNRVTRSVAKNYALLHTNELVNEVSEYIGSEITAVKLLTLNTELIEWINNENDVLKKKNAFNKLEKVSEVLNDKNLFVVVNNSKNIYYMEEDSTYSDFTAKTELDENITEDIWYFKTLESKEDYIINVDTDRVLKSIRLWINIKIYDESKNIIGVAGLGIHMDKFIDELFKKHMDMKAKTFIVNQFGHIQLDSNVGNIRENSFDSSAKLNQTIYGYINEPEVNQLVEKYFDGDASTQVYELKDNKTKYIVISPIKNTHLYVVTIFDSKTLYSSINLFPIIFTLLLTMILMSAIGIFFFRNNFVVPFEKLKESLIQKSNHPEYRMYGIEREDEFGLLACLIEDLTTKLTASVPVGIFVLEQSGRFTYVNQYILTQFEIEHKMDTIKDLEKYFVDKKAYFKMVDNIENNIELYVDVIEFSTKSGSTFWADIRVKKIFDNLDEFKYEGILINMQSQKEYEKQLLDLATKDQLTGLYNRRHFDKIIEDEINRCIRYGGVLSLIVFDLDFFKKVNDNYGHDVGDEVLVNIANLTKKLLRSSDTLARWGGEEFIILMPGTTTEGAIEASEKIRIKLADYKYKKGFSITASFGVAERIEGECYKNWFKRADDALFESKQNGRNRVTFSKVKYDEKYEFLELKWQESFLSHNAYIDYQHYILFKLANKLISSVLSKDKLEEVIEIYIKIINHTEKHFKDEEKILRILNFPDSELKYHHEEHKHLLNKLYDVEKNFKEGNINSIELFVVVLDEVVLEHMIKEDIKYYEYTKRKPTKKQLTDLNY